MSSCQKLKNDLDRSFDTDGVRRSSRSSNNTSKSIQPIISITPLAKKSNSVPIKKTITLTKPNLNLNLSKQSNSTNHNNSLNSLGKTIVYRTSKPKMISGNFKEEFIKTSVNALINSFLPINFFDNRGIRDYFQKLISLGADYGNVDIETILPNGEETKKAFNDLIDRIVKNLKTDLEKLSSVTLLIDNYTCKLRNERFVLIATQYLSDDEGSLNNRIIGLKQFSEFELKQNEFDDYLNLLGLQTKKLTIVSSNDPKEHFKDEICRRMSWWNCSINQLNQILSKMMNSLDSQSSCAEIVYFTERCPSIINYFDNLQTSKLTSIIANQIDGIKTEQNSTDDLFDSINNTNKSNNNNSIDQKVTHEIMFKALNLLKEHESTLFDDTSLVSIIGQMDLLMLNKIRTILNNFYEAKKFISASQNNITFNLVLPCYKKLTMVCRSDEETDFRIKIFKDLLNSLLIKFFCVSDKHKFATFLTPKFRTMRNLCAADELELLITKLKLDLKQEKNEDVKKEDDIFFEFCKTDADDIGLDEVDNYLKFSFANQDLCDNPLKFWKRNGETFPRLSKYSINLLSIPASSTGMAEDVFVKKDLINLSKRIPIQKQLNEFLFINSNLDLINQTHQNTNSSN